jgi:hypothetical protein
MIPRFLTDASREKLFQGKAVLLFGARQTGKTTLVEKMLLTRSEKVLTLNGDDADVRELFLNPNPTRLKHLFQDHRLVFIDEAQRIPDVGLVLKIIVDRIKEVQVIASGSSSFDLAQKTGEPFTGRKFEFLLYPLSFGEMVAHHGLLEEKRCLEERLVFGSYPEIVTNPHDARNRLKLLASSYLYKDLLLLEQLHRPALLEKLLKALALQVGSEISMHEIGQTIGADSHTVEKYLEVLEKAFIIFRLSALSRNVRNELKKGKKVYFFDNGIRNAVIGNFLPLSKRTDVGPLWENYLMSERRKVLQYHQSDAVGFFWRTTVQQEIDYIEETAGTWKIYECKWNPQSRVHFPKTFFNSYPVTQALTVTPANQEEFLLLSDKS